MKVVDQHAKDHLLNRLHRIEGQVRGVCTMVDEERDCREVLQQLSAIRSAVQSVTMLYLKSYVSGCLVDNLDQNTDRESREQLVDELIELLGKTP